jgi:hypothetical protein
LLSESQSSETARTERNAQETGLRETHRRQDLEKRSGDRTERNAQETGLRETLRRQD